MVGTVLVLGLMAMGSAYADQPGGIPLKKPALVNEGAKGFYADEVGICAYVHVGEGLDIDKFKDKLEQVEEIGEDYVIGTRPVSGFNEEEWPYVYANKDGWIVAYYPRGKPTSYLIQGGYIDEPGLYKVVKYLVSSGYYGSIKFYHFGYPEATEMLIVYEASKGVDYFSISVPNNFTIYDVSWWYNGGGSSSYVKLDENTLVSGGSRLFGSIDKLELGKEHTIEVKGGYYTTQFYIIILYSKKT